MSSTSSQPRKGAKGKIIQFKEALGKDLIKIQKYSNDPTALSSSFYERISDILRQLEELPIDLPLLTETLIGTTVSKLKKCRDPQVATLAKGLIKKWKETAKDSGISSGPSSKSAQAIAKQSSGSAPSSVKKAVKPNGTSTVKSSSPVNRATMSSNTAAKATSSTPEPAEWSHLPQLRKNVCSKIHTILSSNAGKTKVEPSLIISISTQIESAIHDFSKNDRQKYSEKARSLSFNFKKNSTLCAQILDGLIEPQRLPTMTSQQLATSEKVKERMDVVKKTQDARLLNWEEQNEEKINEMCGIKGELLQASLFTCGRCKSTKTTSTQKQTRSADEPMTVFVLCINCGNRWKC